MESSEARRSPSGKATILFPPRAEMVGVASLGFA